MFDDAWRRTRPHQPFFCEENVWRLLVDGALSTDSAAVFVTNAQRTVAMWGQRAARVDPVVWDYHVVALTRRDRLLPTIVDLDDRERVAWPLRQWLEHAFSEDVEPEFAPRFRVVPRAQFVATFSSDRSHMRDAAGRERQPFPKWPAPYRPELGMTLPRFLDLDDAIAGVVTDRRGLGDLRL